MFVKCMSFNTQHCLNYITREIDFDVMAKAIIDCGADIIGLQEIRNEGPNADYQNQTKILAEKAGFEYYYFAEAIRFDGVNPYGNAIISRFPIKHIENITIPDPEVRKYDGYYETRCLLKAEIDIGDGLTVCVSHFGLNPDEHENAVSTCIANIEKEKCVLMGDFNMQPDNTLLCPIRERLFDTASLFDGEKFSFPSDAPIKKIDYIFTSEDLKVISADIPAIVSADHRPHIAVIEL